MRRDSDHKPNGHLDVPGYAGVDVPDPLKDVVSPIQGESVFEMQTGLFNLGRNRALQSGTDKSRPEEVESLSDHARAMARQTYRDKFDPSANAHDAMQKAEYDRLFAQRADAEIAEQHAAANLRDAEIKLANMPKAGPKPQAHPIAFVAFIAAITVSVAPTLHDLLAVSDDLLAWFFAALSSALIGFMVTWAILCGRRSKYETAGVVAGIVIAIGLCIVRLAATGAAGDKGIAVGLTVVEIATVLFLEWVASGLRTRDAEWLPKHDVEMQGVAARDAALGDLTRRRGRVQELEEAIDGKIAMVENRHNRNIHLPELEAVAIKAVLDGYNAGITENIGILRGVRSTRRIA